MRRPPRPYKQPGVLGCAQPHLPIAYALIQRGGGKRPCEARQPSRRERCSPGEGANSADALASEDEGRIRRDKVTDPDEHRPHAPPPGYHPIPGGLMTITQHTA